MKRAIGGQAVIEGVMMRSDNAYSIAVRRKDKKIHLKKENNVPINKRNKFLNIPFLRGTPVLFETLILGMKALSYSANIAVGDEGEEISKWEITITILLALVLGIGLFVALPLFLTKLLIQEGIIFNLIDGVLRLSIFVIYISAISLMKDIRILYQYHGAEHMAVNCYDANKKLTVENVKKYSTAHARCGTLFILIVLIISIVIFSLIATPNIWIKLAGRIILIPIIAGIAYELLKLGDKFHHNKIVRLFTLPGMLIQKLTTRQPDDKQIEVAIKALNAVK